MTKFKRIIKGGFINFKRGGIVSWAAVLVVTITLCVITLIILFQAVLHFSLDQVENKVDVTVYFTVGAPEDQIQALKTSLEQMPEVASVDYTSADDALALFRTRHENDYPTIQALDEIGENPLGGYLNIKAKQVSEYGDIANFLQSDNVLSLNSASIIDKVDYNQNELVIDRLNTIISNGQKLGFLITLILIIISIIVTFNTIRLTIFISKEEIGVMGLVGASRMHIRGPFMIAGAIYGILATIITLLLFWPATLWLGHNMTAFLGINMYDYYLASFFQIFTILLLSGILLGVISSFLAVRKYLNK
ncbi:MAG: permease-like cell division protein FtsX [Candidatus Pacebacteria bacterium]|nr:permease-like cell division protein FtsX [Candidatus Paceibacterota bacterium]